MTGMRNRSIASVAAALAMISGASAASRLPDLFGIGRNSLGESCFAQFDKSDPALADPSFDKSYSLSCRSSVASRKVGTIRRVANRPDFVAAIEKTLQCGAAQPVILTKIGAARSRRCADQTLGSTTVVVDFVRGGAVYYGSGGVSLAGPLEQGLNIVAGNLDPADADLAQVKPSFSVEGLAAAGTESGEAADAFNAENALRQGIRFNQQGLHIDASRLLNDAISRTGAEAPADLRGQLELEAALADSNIGFFEPADGHFAKARELLATSTNALVQRKATSYTALHDINRRKFREAITKLDQLASETGGTDNPLRDPIVLAGVNMAPRGKGNGDIAAVGADDTAALQQRVVDAVVDWARSTALLSIGKVDLAQQRINTARRSFEVVKGSRIDVSQSLWLEARIERQAGRIAARKGDWDAAVASFDRALSVLREAQVRNPGFGSGEIANAQVERADIIARRGAPRDEVMREFAAALDSIAASGTQGVVDPGSIERYLDILANGTEGTADADMAERLFRALQLADDPAIARQVSQLQSVVSADPALGSQFRERTDLSKDLVALRYEISRKSGEDVTALERRRTALEKRLAELDDVLASNSRFRATDQTPATVKEVRDRLRDGEAYFKLATLRRNAYGVYIDKSDVFVFRAPATAAELNQLAVQLRASIIPQKVDGRLVVPGYRVGMSYELFKRIAGPAAGRLTSVARLVVDPSGPLNAIPIGVLVTDQRNVQEYVARTRQKQTSYENVAFLARRAEISTALSPRSFVVGRNQPGSQAPKRFIGFGEHKLPTAEYLNAVAPFETRTGCEVDGQTLADSYYYPGLKPISSAELSIAADELGDRAAPIVTGDDFSDKAVMSRDDLKQYEVLHFATHGFVEGNWLFCRKSPPSLLTSLASGGSDGVLSFDEIAGLDLDANLVFLAACDTAVGVEDKGLALATGLEDAGGSLEGLVRAFLTANTRAVIATSWVAPDGPSTLELVRKFYEKGRTSDIGAALREGQMALMSDPKTAHPYRWGPFFVVGDASKSLIGPNASASAPVPVAHATVAGAE